ncbi:MAG TPA: ABC transporter ATP-binding protein [Spirochaetales bacterium]|nr:ABC transporter ATP-binding protein [Spirochaetales bacterium]HOV37842.1 ABC transporter ATP-binding protein [Spirochaetales bacterium]
MLEARGVCKFFGDVPILDSISFQVDVGKTAALLGPNGAGKTTLLRILAGILYPSAGTVQIAGTDLGKDPIAAKKQIGYLSETCSLYTDIKVEEYLRFLGKVRNVADLSIQVEKVAEWFQLEPILRKRISALSPGVRKRVGLAAAFLPDPPVLLLDEPTSSLDPEQIFQFYETVESLKGKKTILLSTHSLEVAEALCSYGICIDQGKIVAKGTKEELSQKLGYTNPVSWEMVFRGWMR